MTGKLSWFHIWLAVSSLTIIHLAIFDWLILTAQESIQVQYIPDDAFYYLVLARNFRELKLWSFDGGFSVTSGFHPLLAYLLMLFHSFFQPKSGEFIQIGIALSSSITLITLSIVWWVGYRLRNTVWLFILAIMAGSKNFIYQSVSSLEWSFVILFAALYTLFFFYALTKQPRMCLPILFMLGLVGSLSRSDFGLLPLSILVGSLLSRNRAAIASAFSGVCGAVAGVCLIFLHNFYFTGQFMPASVVMKAYWRSILEGSIFDPMFLALNTIGFSNNYFTIFLLAALVCLIVLLRRPQAGSRSGTGLSERDLIVLSAASICLVGYCLVYTLSRPIQPWYTANLYVPVFMLLDILINSFRKKSVYHRGWIARMALSAIAVTLISQNIISAYPIGALRSPWPHQQIMRQAGIYLQQHPLPARVGSWNAGIIGYYQGGNVINIDGLMNDAVHPYIRSNTLADYLSRNEIHYLVDFLNMFSPEARLAGGYDVPEFLERLHPVHTFDKGEYNWKYLTLFEITP